ncbi:bifunctional diaminohydroxyphosphoribosylaminopyrimidine deaminase/5-amino-6-(5-phosphoribosylamino)uracil reductase RibD [Tropheryma whipplei]|uniref:bifunctional diaminohydroxyphosphoribosylaminopyrimidine deaminase/5-amino-6-(5-phosphoribosylamino)uracil reductase RibD n=1 Tax=Tropheryma whipplei TaxID=2039 RepID=UPI001E5808EF|nr:bifunctional diaminohydroxyphosphoribosylaminopyrimidine deaminase/5-amino-6-(5-phosphoribosylamino)uracil reductase RibD [Tropheryma whipplei]MCO8190342.1 bifunctional diaminohydroxyphosphoribosylaminopyrimidine deaminase/5-amino-6-(5-phosphoribosylamino)uracil reductase RibD [Tropheryma whipplei]
MHRAITIAQHGPVFDRNPQVGCVILDRDYQLISQGWHMGSGSEHAEIMALRGAKSILSEPYAAVITLEPCSSAGQTGPCVRALLDAGVKHVVFGVHDPESSGAKVLSEAGVKITYGVLEREVWGLCAKHILPKVRKTPWVIAKRAQGLDGRMSAPDGSSKWITGPYARGHAHVIRSQVDAIAIGSNTLCCDNPSLRAFHPAGHLYAKQPKVVIFSGRPRRSNTAGRGSCELGRCVRGHEVFARDPTILSGKDLKKDMRRLYELGVRSLLLEGGPTLLSSFVREDLVDEFYIYTAPKLLGGGYGDINIGVESISDSFAFQLNSVTRFGDNNLLIRAIKPIQCNPDTRTYRTKKHLQD